MSSNPDNKQLLVTKRDFPVSNDVLELEWETKIKSVLVSCLRNEEILHCIRGVHLCRTGTTKEDSKIVVRITQFKAFPPRKQNPELNVPRATYEDVLKDVFDAFGLAWEIVRVPEEAADSWGKRWEGKGRDFLSPDDPFAPK